MADLVLVTGATGFVGGNIAAHCAARGYRVRVLIRKQSKLEAIADVPCETVIGDILDADSLLPAMQGCRYVFHAAALVSAWRKNRQKAIETNIGGTNNVILACLRQGAERLIYTSTVSAVGTGTHEQALLDEDAQWNLGSFNPVYETTKRKAEDLVREAVAHERLPAVILNPAWVIGTRDIHLSSAILLKNIQRQEFSFCTPGGITIADADAVAEAHLAAAEKGRIGERYILGGHRLTIYEFCQRVQKIVGGKAPSLTLPTWLLRCLEPMALILEHLSRREPFFTRDMLRTSTQWHYFSSAKAERELDYHVPALEETVEKSYRWLRERGLLS